MADNVALGTLGLAISVLVGSSLIFAYILWRIRRRRRDGASDLALPRGLLRDRAYNQLHIARSVSERLSRSGIDTSAAQGAIREAEEAEARRDFETALERAKAAQDLLVRLGGARPVRVPMSASTSSVRAPTLHAPAGRTMAGGSVSDADLPESLGGVALPAESSSTKLPKNKAESRFQLSLLSDDLAAMERSGRGGADLEAARKILTDAQQAYERGDYTEALRLGLRGRRRAGGHLETLPPSPATRVEESVGEAEFSGGSRADAAEPSAPATCANCGQPLRANDRFCRGCGASVKAARCAQCGEALAPDDRFCAACGAPVRS